MSARRTSLWFLAALLFTVTALFSPITTNPAVAAPTVTSAQAGAGWLARQLVNGEYLETEFNGQKFPDYGMTADAVITFAAAGVADEAGAKAITFLAKPENLAGYLGDGSTESYAGAHAKLLLTALVRGQDPASFGGVNLPQRLLSLLSDSGRFSDKSQFGDYSNTFTQSIAIIALDRTPLSAPASAIDFLAGTQCEDGGYPVVFGATPCVSDADATAMASQALIATGKDASRALDWLVGAQNSDGSFVASPPADQPNSNSTGLAAQALRGQRDEAADKAARFLEQRQVACEGPAEHQGAIALDTNGFDPKTAPRATTQAVLGMAGVGLAKVTAAGSSADIPRLACGNPPPTPDQPAPTTPSPVTTGSTKTLANTGAPITGLLVFAGGLLTTGVALVIASRAHRPSTLEH